jgi:hypothetical protein
MTLRPPDLLAQKFRQPSGFDVLESEMLAEKAAALGHQGRQVEKALAALARCPTPEARSELLGKAVEAVWAFFVQRELCGLGDQHEVIRHYGIPREVLARLGAISR